MTDFEPLDDEARAGKRLYVVEGSPLDGEIRYIAGAVIGGSAIEAEVDGRVELLTRDQLLRLPQGPGMLDAWEAGDDSRAEDALRAWQDQISAAEAQVEAERAAGTLTPKRYYEIYGLSWGPEEAALHSQPVPGMSPEEERRRRLAETRSRWEDRSGSPGS